MSTITKRYRAMDGKSDFGFRFVEQDGHFDVVCTDRPSLRGRDSDGRKTHLHRDNRVCFVEGQEPRSLSEAMQRARIWAEFLCRYINTGETEG